LKGARRYFHQALEMAMAERAIPWVLLTFDRIAMLLAGEGERERALELLTLAVHHPSSQQPQIELLVDRDPKGFRKTLRV
jgi:hypothetical protein